MANGKNVGYIRVSTTDQHTERQLDGLALDKVFTDKCSGKDRNRPQLRIMLDYLREGDTLYVHAMDRLGRSLADLLAMVRSLTEQNVAVVFVKNGLTFGGHASATDKLLLAMLGAVAEFERDMMRERQAEGIAKARARGVYKGRKPVLSADQLAEARSKIAAGVPKSALARALGVSRSALYAHLNASTNAAPRPV